MSDITAIRGMNDILPQETPCWQFLEHTVGTILASYGYGEVRLPLVEKTALFKRSIGEVTDIVEKEMYTFEDRNGDSMTLRPEGTAGCVRAAIQSGYAQHPPSHVVCGSHVPLRAPTERAAAAISSGRGGIFRSRLAGHGR